MELITPDYVVTFARYNAWQNKQMKAALEGLSDAALREDRGAFFGSLLATANHILWGDWIWMSRFDGGEGPPGGIPDSTDCTPSVSEWSIARFRMDARILRWAEGLSAIDLTGNLRWYSGALGAEMEKPLPLLVAHMFNHQTHHRGQIHAMATAAGVKGWVSDLGFMPDEGPWL